MLRVINRLKCIFNWCAHSLMQIFLWQYKIVNTVNVRVQLSHNSHHFMWWFSVDKSSRLFCLCKCVYNFGDFRRSLIWIAYNACWFFDMMHYDLVWQIICTFQRFQHNKLMNLSIQKCISSLAAPTKCLCSFGFVCASSEWIICFCF